MTRPRFGGSMAGTAVTGLPGSAAAAGPRPPSRRPPRPSPPSRSATGSSSSTTFATGHPLRGGVRRQEDRAAQSHLRPGRSPATTARRTRCGESPAVAQSRPPCLKKESLACDAHVVNVDITDAEEAVKGLEEPLVPTVKAMDRGSWPATGSASTTATGPPSACSRPRSRPAPWHRPSVAAWARRRHHPAWWSARCSPAPEAAGAPRRAADYRGAGERPDDTGATAAATSPASTSPSRRRPRPSTTTPWGATSRSRTRRCSPVRWTRWSVAGAGTDAASWRSSDEELEEPGVPSKVL